MTAANRIEHEVAHALAGVDRVVLAVSGGVDSMVLLRAATRVAGGRELIVATYDHGTGDFAKAAVEFVRREAAQLGLAFETARRGVGSAASMHSESAWRHARWSFLRAIAEKHSARVATAHTRDDQVETVAMRAVRGAGARGLAGLYAPSHVVRPLLRLTRRDVEEYARRERVPWLDDPSNASRAHFRNRMRHDILPAIAAVRPEFCDELLEIASRAASVRCTMDSALAAYFAGDDGSVVIAHDKLLGVPAAARAFAWQSLAALAGVTLDRRGTARLAREAHSLPIGGRIPLSGRYVLVRERRHYSFRENVEPAAHLDDVRALSVQTVTHFGSWRFSPVSETTIRQARAAAESERPPFEEAKPAKDGGADAWTTWLPADTPLALRSWRDGDRMSVGHGGQRRRVKRFFADRGIAAVDRSGWPVVLDGEEIIWIPGIRRTRAATDRSGRPEVRIICERIDD